MADEVTPQAPPAPQVQAGPWEQDIRQTFTNPEEAARVDAFLRARVQPRVTQLEQELAGTREAQQLWTAFHEDPEGTFRAIQAELIQAGYTVGEAAQMAGDAAAAAASQPAPAAPAATAAQQMEDPRLAEMYAEYQQQKQLAAYDAQIEAIVNDPANADINPNRLHTFVAAADGDFERAIQMYRADVADVLTAYGIDPTTASQQQADTAAQIAGDARQQQAGAPPVMGTGSAAGAGAPVPTTPDYRAEGLSPSQALHRAIDDAARATFRTDTAPPAVS